LQKVQINTNAVPGRGPAAGIPHGNGTAEVEGLNLTRGHVQSAHGFEFLRRGHTAMGKATSIFMIILLVSAVWLLRYTYSDSNANFFTLLLGIPFTYLLMKTVLYVLYRPNQAQQTKDYTVSVVVPFYNEPGEGLIRCVDSLMGQTYPLKEIILVDDGSKSQESYRLVLSHVNRMAGTRDVRFIVHRFKENRGKKQALAWGFQEATGDVLLLFDSDSSLAPDAAGHMMAEFDDDRVYSVTGYAGPSNSKENFLTQMQDYTYVSSFEIGRCAQSRLHSVVVCSGAISMHRRTFVVEHLEEFLDAQVLGIPCCAGDDRLLTNLAQKYGGWTRYQNTAVAATEVPTTLRKYIKQQVRWTKSAYLYTLKALFGYGWKRPVFLFWSVAETYLWLIALILQVVHWMARPAHITLRGSALAVVYYVLLCYLGRLPYLHKSVWYFLISPVYEMVHFVLLQYIRFKAVVTIRNIGWNTR